MSGSQFAELRKSKILTQEELGKKIFERLKRPVHGKYPQKKISLWESGQANPTSDEYRVLSEIFEMPTVHIQRLFDAGTTHLAQDLFKRFANHAHPSVVAVCFSGPPVGTMYPELKDAIVEGLNGNLSYAMVVPFPSKLSVERTSMATKSLENYYESVQLDVMYYRDELLQRVSDNKRSNLAVFRPKAEESPIPLPPFRSRYVLGIQSNEDKTETSGLYLWVKTAEIDELQEIGTTTNLTASDTRSEIKVWEMYFHEILAIWREARSFQPEVVTDAITWKLL
jgi:transcriptional regulator with XRE-family HTH domain